MNNETKKPLYKVLDEKRTQGEWWVKNGDKKYGDDKIFGSLMMGKKKGKYGGEIPHVCFNSSHDQNHESLMANVEYTAMAVNNLANLAECLEDIVSNIEAMKKEVPEWWGKYGLSDLSRYKEALTRIS